jgi:hypothetical protein
LRYKYKDMTWKGFFEGIQSLAENILFAPYDALRLGVDSWWMSNIVSWTLTLIGFIALIYWMGELKKYNDNGEEDKTSTSHSFLE